MTQLKREVRSERLCFYRGVTFVMALVRVLANEWRTTHSESCLGAITLEYENARLSVHLMVLAFARSITASCRQCLPEAMWKRLRQKRCSGAYQNRIMVRPRDV